MVCTRGTRGNIFVEKCLSLWTFCDFSLFKRRGRERGRETVVHEIDYKFVPRKLYNQNTFNEKSKEDPTQTRENRLH